MALVDDKRSGGFTFTWSIHNFSYCVQKESEYLDSPSFVAHLLEGTTWNLRLYPRGDVAPGFISYYLHQDINILVINYVLSVRVSNGLFKEIGEQMFDTRSSSFHGYRKFVSLDELKGPDTYLENDILTLRCRMWLYDNDLPTSIVEHFSQAMQCYAHTKIKVTKLKYIWTLNELIDSDHKYKFNQTTQVQPMSTEIPCFTIRVLHEGTFVDDDIIYFGIELVVEHNNLILTCMIHLLDCDGSIAHSLRCQYLFEKSNETQIWTLPFLSKRKLLSKENVYLPSGRLTLRCEFSVSTGTVSNEMEIFEYGIIEDLQLKTAIPTQVPDLTWKKNMQRFYMEGKFSDLTVCTPNRQFPVHKAILCAQSEVFSAMFENDMEENHTGIVKIEDLENDTVFKMLLFLYTDTLDDINCSMAHKLYYAADKYRITALYKKCSNYLIHSLDISNVCNVLVLADVHQDQELKSISQDFISSHAHEIMNSEDWKKLMEANSRLTSETMKLMICKNFMGHLKP